MITFLGWAVLALGGAWLVFYFVAALAMALLPGGLEVIPRMLWAGGVGAAIWFSVIVWLSPLTFNVSG